MVYLGPSKGCLTCKRRRKKCDETKPSCLRCAKANRTCGGYEEESTRTFRHHRALDFQAASFESKARKCSLPVGLGDEDDDRPSEITEETSEEYALRAFYYDYCVISTNQALSRGYLHGLEPMVEKAGPQSPIAKACKAVAFANHSIKLRRPFMKKVAERLYQDLLQSLPTILEMSNSKNPTESLIIAMLLGLYEMIMANDRWPGFHDAHAKGVTAILQIENSPMELFGSVQFIRSGNPIFVNGTLKNGDLFSVPSSNNKNTALDDLLSVFSHIWKKADALLALPSVEFSALRELKAEVEALDQALNQWQEAQVRDFKAIEASQLSERQAESIPAVGYWPGRVDKYFDLYVASVWNTYRTARILIINLILKLSTVLEDKQQCHNQEQNAIRLVEDIIASIPYHLTDDLLSFLRDAPNSSEIANPGKLVGGLLLMHPIYIASRLMIIPARMREYLRETLAWIGQNMGIGQASLFATAPEIHQKYFSDGCTIVWTGLLI